MKLGHFFCISAALIFGSSAKSQDSIRCGSWVSANAHYGFIVPVYTSSMTYLIRAHVPGVELDYLHKPSGIRPWEQAFHCPETGLAFFFAWLGNPAELGNMIGVYPFINFHLQHSYKEALYFRVGMGIGYMPVIFDRVTNYKDNLIGSHINAMVNLRLTTHFYLTNKMRLEAGLGLTHCSDGNFKTPNLGINLATLNTGLSYCLNAHKVIKALRDSTLIRKHEDDFIVGVGLSQIEPPGGSYYGAITFSYLRYYFLSRKSKLGGGMDVFYNNANNVILNAEGTYLKNSIENTQLGIKASYELALGKLSIPMEIGKYVYTKIQTTANMYNRFGLRYYVNKHLIVNLTLLTHFASAVYIEWGAGFKI